MSGSAVAKSGMSRWFRRGPWETVTMTLIGGGIIMASDPRCLPALLNCGLRELSVTTSALAQIKQTIDRLGSGGGLG